MRRTTFESTKDGRVKMEVEEKASNSMRWNSGITEKDQDIWVKLPQERRVGEEVTHVMLSRIKLRSAAPDDVPPPFCEKCRELIWSSLGKVKLEFETALVVPDWLPQPVVDNDMIISHTCVDRPNLPCAACERPTAPRSTAYIVESMMTQEDCARQLIKHTQELLTMIGVPEQSAIGIDYTLDERIDWVKNRIS